VFRISSTTVPLSPHICCLDLDTFFVSVERLFDPSLAGRPVVVGATPGHRGVVTAASYEVRPLGVHSGMPISEAFRLAPHAVFVPTRHEAYGGYSARVRTVIERTCPVVQAASIDEFYLDFFGCEELFRKPADKDADATIERVVWEMRNAIQAEVGLPASVGIGTTRAIAKIASGRAKPAGVKMVRAGQEYAFVEDLPVRKFPGIGPVTEARLNASGIVTLGQLLALPPGRAGGSFSALAESVRRGIDAGHARAFERDRPAFREHDVPGEAEGSISNERTFMADIQDVVAIEAELRALVERVAWRARQRGMLARTVTVKLRYADFSTCTRSHTEAPTHEEARILSTALSLLRENRDSSRAIRLLGVALSGLQGPGAQLDLPFGNPGRPPIGKAIDRVRERFGYEAIRMGATHEGRG
jgi:DNA polymerase IV